MLVEMDQHIGRKLVKLPLPLRVLVEIFAQPPIAEIAEQQQAAVEVAGQDLGRAQARPKRAIRRPR